MIKVPLRTTYMFFKQNYPFPSISGLWPFKERLFTVSILYQFSLFLFLFSYSWKNRRTHFVHFVHFVLHKHSKMRNSIMNSTRSLESEIVSFMPT